MLKRFRRIVRDQKGATAIEYGLIVSLIVVALISALSALGSGTDSMWGKVQNRAETYM